MAHTHPAFTARERQLIAPCPVASVMCRTFDALSAGGHFAASWLVCDWARVVTSARRSALPIVKADRLRAAAEFRAEIARQKGEAVNHGGGCKHVIRHAIRCRHVTRRVAA